MSLQNGILDHGTSAADLSTKRGYACSANATAGVVLSAVDGADFLGILTEPGSASGDEVGYILLGPARAVYGGNVNEGDFLTTTAAGKLVAVDNIAEGICARAKEAGADGEFRDVVVLGGMFSYVASA